MEKRKAREKTFHDARFSADEARPSDRFYTITGGSRRVYDAKLLGVRAQEQVLELGCGPASSAFALAAKGARVTAIDISPIAVELAHKQAGEQNVEIAFEVMDAEALEFDDESFDVVCGSGILHHLSLTPTFRQLARVLRHNGTAVFMEPLGHNPLVNWYRSRTPAERTPDEHPLILSDFELATTYFQDVNVSYHHLATLAALPFCSTRLVGGLSRALDAIDRAVFTLMPSLGRFAWVVIVELGRPKQIASAERGKSA